VEGAVEEAVAAGVEGAAEVVEVEAEEGAVAEEAVVEQEEVEVLVEAVQ
jgi:hypothetical protein